MLCHRGSGDPFRRQTSEHTISLFFTAPDMFTVRIRSGIDVIDSSWEGLRRGATYLVYGRAAVGRDVIGLQMARSTATEGGRCFIVSTRTPEELSATASHVGLNFDDALESGVLRLLRVPPGLLGAPDENALADAFVRLRAIVCDEQPDLLLIEDFAPFVRYSNFARLRHAALQLIETVTGGRTTLVIGLGEPMNEHSHEIVAFLRGQVAGSIHIGTSAHAGESGVRRLTLHPPPGSLLLEESYQIDLQRMATQAPNAGGPASGDGTGRAYTGVDVAPAFDTEPPTTPDSVQVLAVSSPSGESDQAPAPHDQPDGAPIRYFDPVDPLASPPDIADPFAGLANLDELLQRGLYLEAGATAGNRAASVEQSLPERERFVQAFDQARSAEVNKAVSFLAVAVRIMAGSTEDPSPRDVARAIDEVLAGDPAALRFESGSHVLALLPGRAGDQARPFLLAVRERLKHRGLDSARALQVFVAENGRPFESGNVFLRHVLTST